VEDWKVKQERAGMSAGTVGKSARATKTSMDGQGAGQSLP